MLRLIILSAKFFIFRLPLALSLSITTEDVLDTLESIEEVLLRRFDGLRSIDTGRFTRR